MDFAEWITNALEISAYCFVLGFCGSLGMVSSFWLASRFFDNAEDNGVVGH